MITTATTKWVNLLDLQPEDIDIEDIAHALAQVNRFNGHLKRPVSVAQHSVYVARLCRNTPHRLQALLHDASEAYVADITFYLKNTPAFEEYRRLEDKIQRTVYRKFGVDEVMSEEVRYADRLMARFEAYKGFGNGKYHLPGLDGQPSTEWLPPTEDEIKAIGRWAPWEWKWSRDIFMAEFRMAVDASPEARERMAEGVRQRALEILVGQEAK
jgi:hypothetical protein